MTTPIAPLGQIAPIRAPRFHFDSDFGNLIDVRGSADVWYIDGNDGDDRIYGAGGADTLIGDQGSDTIDGGAGNDSISGGAGRDSLLGGDGNDRLDGGDANDTIHGGAHNDTLLGGLGDDILAGGIGDDLMHGDLGADTINGGLGRDTVSYANSAAAVDIDLRAELQDGRAGSDSVGDRIVGVENVIGSRFDDTMVGGDEDNVFSGGAGRDNIYAAGGANRIDGGDGEDDLYGGFSNDTINGDGGDDYIFTGGGANVANGGSGYDIYGCLTDGRSGFDVDLMLGTASGAGVNDRLSNIEGVLGSTLDDVIDGDDRDNGLHGDAGNDWIFGAGGQDMIGGDDGQDTLAGGAGADSLWGGDENDMLIGGLDRDMLYGHGGDDVFRFTRMEDSRAFTGNVLSADFVADFEDDALGQDIIDLSPITFNGQPLFFNNGDAVVDLGEVLQTTVTNEFGRTVSAVFADLSNDGVAFPDFMIVFDRVIESFDAGDFRFV